MLKRASHLLWLILTVRFAAAAEIPLIPRYEVGDVAVADLIAPVAFAVPNPEETKRLQELGSSASAAGVPISLGSGSAIGDRPHGSHRAEARAVPGERGKGIR